jgi:hypothetical protein
MQNAESDFLDSLAKLHAEQLFQQIVSSAGELKTTSHGEITLREFTEKFSQSLAAQVNAACQANSIEFCETRLKDIVEANCPGANGLSDEGDYVEESSLAAAMAAATTAPSSSDYILAAGQAINSTNLENDQLDGDDTSANSTRPKSGARSFFRRFSLSGLTLGRGFNMFHKQHSDEVELSTSNGDLNGSAPPAVKAKPKVSKLLVRVVRQGVLKMIRGDSSAMLDGKPCWEKCRVTLVKAAGGHMLEFFVPPKVRRTTNRLIMRNIGVYD